MTILISGTTYGIGKAIADLFLKNSNKVIGLARGQLTINHPNYKHIQIDITNTQSLLKLANQIDSKIDLLIHNAGTIHEESVLNFTRENFSKTFELNFIAPIELTKTLKDKLAVNASIYFISSLSDRLYGGDDGIYCASKAAINALAGALAVEMKHWKIVSILPTFVNTPLLKNLSLEPDFDFSSIPQPEEVADCIFKIKSEEKIIPSGARILVVNNNYLIDEKNPENLYSYNASTKKITQLRKSEI